jgi:hypothetical protein
MFFEQFFQNPYDAISDKVVTRIPKVSAAYDNIFYFFSLDANVPMWPLLY